MSVSVIIPTYNRAHTLPRAIESVFAQTSVAKIELIVVDDGSTDGSSELVTSAYPQVKLIRQANQGVSAARNAGLSVAAGEWIALLDSDDEWLPHKLETQLEQLDALALYVSHTEEIWIRNGVRVNQHKKHAKRGGWIFQHCLPLCAMSPSSIVIHRSVVEEIGAFDQSLPACEDYDYWLRLTSKYEVAFCEQPCINKYGGHEDQLSGQYWGMDRFRVQALEKIIKQPLSDKDRAAAIEMLKQKLNILSAGAKKRENHALWQTCTKRVHELEQMH